MRGSKSGQAKTLGSRRRPWDERAQFFDSVVIFPWIHQCSLCAKQCVCACQTPKFFLKRAGKRRDVQKYETLPEHKVTLGQTVEVKSTRLLRVLNKEVRAQGYSGTDRGDLEHKLAQGVAEEARSTMLLKKKDRRGGEGDPHLPLSLSKESGQGFRFQEKVLLLFLFLVFSVVLSDTDKK